MTHDDDELRRAVEDAAQSKLRAQQDLLQAQERAGHVRSIAARLRELREANGFAALLSDAYGGDHA